VASDYDRPYAPSCPDQPPTAHAHEGRRRQSKAESHARTFGRRFLRGLRWSGSPLDDSPGWFCDPLHWFAYRHWNGQRWSGGIASTGGPAPSGRIEEPSVGRSRGVFVMLGLSIVGLNVLLMAINRLLYGFSLWSDPPPSPTAEHFYVRSIVAFLVAVMFAVTVAVAWWGLSLDPSEPQRFRRSVTIARKAFLHTIPAMLLSMLSIAGFPIRAIRWLRMPTASRRKAGKIWLARSFRGGALRTFGLNFTVIEVGTLVRDMHDRGARESQRLLMTNGPAWLIAALGLQALILARLTARGRVRKTLAGSPRRPVEFSPGSLSH
jgi:hypothetical protein